MKTATLSLLLTVVCLAGQSYGKRCPSGVVSEEVDFEVRTLLTPGFPQSYEMNEECTWGLHAAVAGYDIQLAVVEMDLNDIDLGCNNDFLEIFEGDNISSLQKVATWCGQDKKIYKSRRRYVQIKFTSDSHFAGRGFAIEYGLVKPANMTCSTKPSIVEVGIVPVVALFEGRADMRDSSCTWKIQSPVANSNLVFEIYEPSPITCQEGQYTFYEGPSKTGNREFTYCSHQHAFSKFFFSSSMVTISLNQRRTNRRKAPQGLVLKMYTRPKQQECTDSDSFPAIEVGVSPVIFSLPYMKTKNRSCPVKLQTMDSDLQIRLDVMGVDDNLATCDSDVVNVQGSGNDVVTESCNRGNNPVFRGQSRMIVAPKVQNKIFMKAAAVSSECNGVRSDHTAQTSKVSKLSLPGSKDYTNLSQCRALITASRDNEVVALSLKWTLPPGQYQGRSDSDTCNGDYVSVYDGHTSEFPLLYSSCQRSNINSRNVDIRLVSRQRSVLVVLDADKNIEGAPVKLEYHAIEGGEYCVGREEIFVNETRQNLTSLNYPYPLPLKQTCVYDLMAESEDDDIIVNVLDSDLSDTCSTMLTVYQGEYQMGDDAAPVVGRVCGQDRGSFRIQGGHGVLYTKSNHVKVRGGWMVEVYTEPKPQNAASGLWTSGNMVLAVAISVLSVLLH